MGTWRKDALNQDSDVIIKITWKKFFFKININKDKSMECYLYFLPGPNGPLQKSLSPRLFSQFLSTPISTSSGLDFSIDGVDGITLVMYRFNAWSSSADWLTLYHVSGSLSLIASSKTEFSWVSKLWIGGFWE